jgi:hypothetical protein
MPVISHAAKRGSQVASMSRRFRSFMAFGVRFADVIAGRPATPPAVIDREGGRSSKQGVSVTYLGDCGY